MTIYQTCRRFVGCADAGSASFSHNLMRFPAIAPALLYHLHPWRRTSCDPHGCGKCQSGAGTSQAIHAVVPSAIHGGRCVSTSTCGITYYPGVVVLQSAHAHHLPQCNDHWWAVPTLHGLSDMFLLGIRAASM